MNSSIHETEDNLAPKTDASTQLLALKELANLRDDAAAFERFARRWPFFARVSMEYEPPESDAELTGQEYFDKYGYWPTRPAAGYAYGEPMTSMPPSIPKRFFLMWQRREALRKIWRGDSDKLCDVLLPTPEEAMMDPEWVSSWNPQLKLDWHRGEFLYVPRSEFQEAVYKLFRRSAFVKLCANPNCPAQYFIAHKTAQRYCAAECAQVFQRKWKRRWWKEKGPKWRRKKSRGKRGKG